MSDDQENSSPLDALTNAKGIVPWTTLQEIAEALAMNPLLWERLAEIYRGFASQDTAEKRFDGIYALVVLVMVKPRMNEWIQREIADFLIEARIEADNTDDVLGNIVQCICREYLEIILPKVLDRLERNSDPDDGAFDLYVLLDLALETGDSSLRNRTVELCLNILQKSVEGTYDPEKTFDPGYTLARMKVKKAIPLLESLIKKGYTREYQYALDELKENKLQYFPFPDPVQKVDYLSLFKELIGDLKKQHLQPEDLEGILGDKDGPWNMEEETDPVLDRAEGLASDFAASSRAGELANISPEVVHSVAYSLLELAWLFDWTEVEDLTVECLHKLLTEVFPGERNDPEQLKHLIPVTQAFLRWLGDTKILSNAETLAMAVGKWQRKNP